jgi:hypothetical protein
MMEASTPGQYLAAKQDVRPHIDSNDVRHRGKGCYASAELGEESGSTNLLFLQKNKCPVFTQQTLNKVGLTHMTAALQPENTAEGRLGDGFIDDLGIFTKKGHFGVG